LSLANGPEMVIRFTNATTSGVLHCHLAAVLLSSGH